MQTLSLVSGLTRKGRFAARVNEMKPLYLIIALLIIFSCIGVAHDALKKNHFNRKPEIVFYSHGQPVWKERGTHKDAERIMLSNPKFDFYEIE